MRYILTAALLLCAGTSHAASVADIYEACSHNSNKCMYYFDGYMDGVVSYSAVIKGKTLFCTSDRITPQAAGALFVKGLNEDAKLKDAPAAGIAFTIILQKQYPCTGK
jgi:hypothetical protein